MVVDEIVDVVPNNCRPTRCGRCHNLGHIARNRYYRITWQKEVPHTMQGGVGVRGVENILLLLLLLFVLLL
jgi:hypothetical protein